MEQREEPVTAPTGPPYHSDCPAERGPRPGPVGDEVPYRSSFVGVAPPPAGVRRCFSSRQLLRAHPLCVRQLWGTPTRQQRPCGAETRHRGSPWRPVRQRGWCAPQPVGALAAWWRWRDACPRARLVAACEVCGECHEALARGGTAWRGHGARGGPVMRSAVPLWYRGTRAEPVVKGWHAAWLAVCAAHGTRPAPVPACRHRRRVHTRGPPRRHGRWDLQAAPFVVHLGPLRGPPQEGCFRHGRCCGCGNSSSAALTMTAARGPLLPLPAHQRHTLGAPGAVVARAASHHAPTSGVPTTPC